MPAFVTTRRVEFRDTDAAGIAHFSVFLLYFEQAEHELLRSLGWSVHQQVEGETVSWPRVSVRCDYRAAVRFEEIVTIELVVRRLGTSSITYAARFLAAGRLLADGEMAVVCCRLDPARAPQKRDIPSDLRARLTPFLEPNSPA